MFERDPTTATIGVEILPFELGYLPEFFQKKGEVEIRYTQSVREKSLRELKEAIAEDDSINGASFTDECFLMLLTNRKYNVSEALTKMKKLMNFKRENEFFFKIPSFDVLSVFMTSELVTVLPWRCQDGCALILIQLGRCNSVQHPLEAMKQFYALLFSQCLRDPMTQVNGFKIIIDFDMTLEVLKLCTPENMHLLIYVSQTLLPGRFKKFHFLNTGIPGRIVYHICKIFMSKKMKQRVQFHASIDTLLDFFPRAVLPTKYGGDLKEYDMTEWLRKISSPEGLKWLSNIY